jgi:hypothetical protein
MFDSFLNCYSTVLLFTNAYITDNTMAKEVIDRLAPKVRGMLRILHMPDVKDGEMRELIVRLGQTSKWERVRTYPAFTKAITVQQHCVEKNGEAGLTSCPIDFVSPETPPLTPPSTEDNTRRRSSRLASHSTKRSYIAMQGTNSGAGKPKPPKLPADKPEVNDSATSESTLSESPPSGPTVETSVISEPTINDLFITEPAVYDSSEIEASMALTNNAHRLFTDEILSRASVYTTKQGDGTIGQNIEGDAYTITHDDGMALLDGYFPNSPVDLGPADDALALDTLLRSEDEDVDQNCPLAAAQSNLSESLTTAQQPSNASPIPNATFLAPGTLGLQNLDQIPETHDANHNLPSAPIDTHMVKRVILDESGHQLEDVMKALGEADDTSRIPNSYVPGISEYLLAKSASTDYSKIMTSLAVNCVRCNRRTARPVLGVEQEKLREFERKELRVHC